MDVNLSGSETMVIKALGLSGNPMPGTNLKGQLPEFGEAELLDALQALMAVGYVVADSEGLSSASDVLHTTFRVNTSYARDLRDALYPNKNRSSRVHWRGGR